MQHSQVFTPWATTLSQLEYRLVLFFLVMAGLALLAGFLRALLTLREVGPRYRPAGVANACILGIAALSYGLIVLEFRLGYTTQGDLHVPNAEAVYSFITRYMDWSITVPLLVAEFIAVTTLVGRRAARARYLGMGAAFLMIATGFVGGAAIGDGRDVAALVEWGLVSTAFYLFLYGLLLWAVAKSSGLRGETSRALHLALVVLVTVWLVYPLVYLVQIVAEPSGTATAVIHVAFSVADVIAKVGFGAVVHRVAKLRTAEDVRAGVDEDPESVWIGSVKQADAVLPPVVAEERRVPVIYPESDVRSELIRGSKR